MGKNIAKFNKRANFNIRHFLNLRSSKFRKITIISTLASSDKLLGHNILPFIKILTFLRNPLSKNKNVP